MRSLREPITAVRGVWDEARETVQFQEQLDLGRTRVIRCRDADVGFVMAVAGGDAVEIHTLCVAPEHQGRGIGGTVTRALVGQARAGGRDVRLTVLKRNRRARDFWERLRFVVVGESAQHHRMRLSLTR